VRQLENVCHWLTVMAPAQVIEPKDLPAELTGRAASAVGAPAERVASASAPASDLSRPASEPAELAPLVAPEAPMASDARWLADLENEARRRLEAGQHDVWDSLTREFEGRMIRTALALTRGRRIEAAQKLGIGRNTITRKIQELGLDD
jgi:two-component system nitrogen regulation response regulator GlnG